MPSTLSSGASFFRLLAARPPAPPRSRAAPRGGRTPTPWPPTRRTCPALAPGRPGTGDPRAAYAPGDNGGAPRSEISAQWATGTRALAESERERESRGAWDGRVNAEGVGFVEGVALVCAATRESAPPLASHRGGAPAPCYHPRA
eukprot:7379252-Prymnesium_polylepis.2